MIGRKLRRLRDKIFRRIAAKSPSGIGILESQLKVSRPETRFILHIGGGIDDAYHIDLWYPFIKTVEPETLIAIRSLRLYHKLSLSRPDLPVVFVKDGLRAEHLVSNCPNLVAVLYAANTGNTIHFLRFNHVSHVFLGHGDSEKAASSHKFFRAYDEVWTAGRAHIDRFASSGMNYAGLHFRVIGRPTLRNLLQSQPDQDGFLYLPTWEGFQAEQDYTSIPVAETFIPAIAALTKKKAVVKFHPWAGKRVSALKDIEAHLPRNPGKDGIEVEVAQRSELAADLMKQASFLIADISSVVSDFLPTGRPIFLFVPQDRQVRTSASAVPMESYCYLFSDEETLRQQIQRVIVDGDDWLRDQRLKVGEYFVDSARSLGLAFEQSLRDLIDEHEQPANPWARARRETPATAVRRVPKIIGHRGAKGLWPENSLSGFAGAVEMKGLDGVEFDLHLTSDGEIVVLHDPLLDRTTTGSGPVSDRTLAELRELRLIGGKKTEPILYDEGIPTLGEVLEILGPGGQEMHIELKNDALGMPYPGLIEKTLAQLKAAGLSERSILTSFSPEVLLDVRAHDADIALLASVNYRSLEQMGGPERCLQRLGRIPGCALALEEKLLAPLMKHFPELVDPRRVGVWVLNNKELIQSAVAQRVLQITSDRPDIAIKCLKKGDLL